MQLRNAAKNPLKIRNPEVLHMETAGAAAAAAAADDDDDDDL